MLEAPALVASFDDLAMMGQAVEQRGGHLGVAEHRGPFSEGEVGSDDDRGALVEPAHHVEQELSSGLGEGQVTEFVDNDEIAPGELLGGAALATGPELDLELVNQLDGVIAAPAEALPDTGADNGGGEDGSCRRRSRRPAQGCAYLPGNRHRPAP